MAESILKLKVDSQEYDSKVRRAAQGIQALGVSLQKAGKSFLDADKDQIAFTRELGSMSTVSQSAKGKVGELSAAFVDLSAKYRQMTDEEKKSPFGKAMAASIEQLKERTIEARNELKGFEQQLQGVSDKIEEISGNSGDGLFGGKIGGMLQVFGGNMMTAAVNQMGDIVRESVNIAQASEGIEMAFARLNRPDLLNQLKEATHGTVSELELMKAAVKFDDFKLPVEELGTMLAFAQKKAKETGQSVDYMVDSIVTGLGRKSLMILDNLGLSASEIKDKMAETGDMTSAVGEIIRDQMAKAGGYVETAADRAARAAADQQNAMRDLGRSLAPIAQTAAAAFSAITTGATTAIRFLIENKNVVLTVSSAVAAYTIVVNANTIAINAQKAATIAATVAQKALNLAMKASPWGLFAAGAAAAVTALVAFSDKSSEVSQREKDEREVRIQQMERERAARERLAQKAREQANAISSAVGSVEAKYKTLQTEWLKLTSVSEKNQFIRDNANAFQELGRTITTAADAEKFFVENADKVIEALKAIAEADAMKDLLTEEYKRRATYNPSKINRNDYATSTAEMRLMTPANLNGGRDLGTTQRERQAAVQKYIQDWINSNSELKAAGVTPSDFRSNSTYGGQIEFHANSSAFTKLDAIRKQNYLQQLADDVNKGVEDAEAKYEEALEKARKAQAKIPKFGTGTGGSGGGHSTKTTTTTKEVTETQKLQSSIEALTKEYQQLSDVEKVADVNTITGIEMRKAAIRGEIQTNQKRIEELKKFADEAQGKNISVKVNLETGISGTNESSISEYVKNLQKELASIDYSVAGSFQKALDINSNIIDANTLGNLLKTSIQHGIDLAAAGIDVESIFEKITSGEGLEDADWKGFVDKINEQLKKQGIKISIDTDTGNISSKGKEKSNPLLHTREDGKTELKINETLSSLAGGLSNIASGLEDLGVKIPEGIKSVISGMQSISTILTGIATTILAIQAISTASLFKPFARGGIIGKAAGGMLIPGNSFSGDNLRLPVDNGGGWIGVNSGELILNQSQQGNLASQLQDGMRGNGFSTQPYVYAEQIWLGLENMLKRQGRGEIVTTKG